VLFLDNFLDGGLAVGHHTDGVDAVGEIAHVDAVAIGLSQDYAADGVDDLNFLQAFDIDIEVAGGRVRVESHIHGVHVVDTLMRLVIGEIVGLTGVEHAAVVGVADIAVAHKGYKVALRGIVVGGNSGGIGLGVRTRGHHAGLTPSVVAQVLAQHVVVGIAVGVKIVVIRLRGAVANAGAAVGNKTVLHKPYIETGVVGSEKSGQTSVDSHR